MDNCKILKLKYQERDEDYNYIKLTSIIDIFLDETFNYEIFIYANPLNYKYNFVLTDSLGNLITYKDEEKCKECKIAIIPNTLSLIKCFNKTNLTNLRVDELKNAYIIVKYFKLARRIDDIEFFNMEKLQEVIKYYYMADSVTTYRFIRGSDITNYKIILVRNYNDEVSYRINFINSNNQVIGSFVQNDVIIPPLPINYDKIEITITKEGSSFFNIPMFIFLFPPNIDIDYDLLSNVVNNINSNNILYGIFPYQTKINIENNYNFYLYTNDINNITSNIDLQPSSDNILPTISTNLVQYKNSLSPSTINITNDPNGLKAFFVVNPDVL